MDNIYSNYILFWICILGLCLGSFFNVVILRSISGESIVYPPSKCPKCGNKLKPWHNIPVLSYIFLRGKCAFCKEKISIQYPIIELLTMFLFVLSYQKFGFSILTLFVIFWLSCIIIMTVTDIKTRLVDCNIAILMAVAGIFYCLISSGLTGLLDSILGLIAGALVVEVIARLGFLIAKTRAMGEADTYVAGALGAIVGLHSILPVLLYGLVASMIFIIPVFLYNRYAAGDKITCIMSILFITTIIGAKIYPDNILIVALMMIIGLMLTGSILMSMKSEENRNYLPYVPALSAGFLYFLFFVL